MGEQGSSELSHPVLPSPLGAEAGAWASVQWVGPPGAEKPPRGESQSFPGDYRSSKVHATWLWWRDAVGSSRQALILVKYLVFPVIPAGIKLKSSPRKHSQENVSTFAKETRHPACPDAGLPSQELQAIHTLSLESRRGREQSPLLPPTSQSSPASSHPRPPALGMSPANYHMVKQQAFQPGSRVRQPGFKGSGV